VFTLRQILDVETLEALSLAGCTRPKETHVEDSIEQPIRRPLEPLSSQQGRSKVSLGALTMLSVTTSLHSELLCIHVRRQVPCIDNKKYSQTALR